MRVQVSEAWRAAFPGACVGVLALDGVHAAEHSDALDAYLAEVEAELRRRYAGFDRPRLAQLPTVRAYQAHYRAFGQTYHLLGQLESVVLKGRPLRSPGGALVTALFAAEIEHQLLTAGHDADALQGDLEVDRARGGEQFSGPGGREHVLKDGDMLMRDALGIISAVLAGADERTRLRPTSTRVVYVTYAPTGVGQAALGAHMDTIGRLVRLAAPEAELTRREIYAA